MTVPTAKRPKSAGKRGGSKARTTPVVATPAEPEAAADTVKSQPFEPAPRDFAAELAIFRASPSSTDRGGLLIFLRHIAEEILGPLTLGDGQADGELKKLANEDLVVIDKILKQQI